MELFIDSADVDEVRRAAALGVVSGVTTNPKLAAAAEPGSFQERVGDILACCRGPVSVEVLSERSLTSRLASSIMVGMLIW